jgi:hypothetical protein
MVSNIYVVHCALCPNINIPQIDEDAEGIPEVRQAWFQTCEGIWAELPSCFDPRSPEGMLAGMPGLVPGINHV